MRENLKKLRDFQGFSSFIAVWVAYFIPLLFYIFKPLYVDEADNLIGGHVLASGGLIYRDYYSQHTPFLYFLIASFIKMGFHSLIALRIAFYLTMSLIFTLIYFGYRKSVGRLPLFVGTLLFLTSYVSNQAVSYAILSDQLQGIAYFILLVLLFKVIRDKQITTKDVLIMSVSSFVAIGAAFVSVYFVFVWSLTLISVLIQREFTKTGKGALDVKKILHFFNSRTFYIRLSIFLVPYFVAVVYLIGTGTLHDFYSQAYLLNRTVYVIYSGGIGLNILSPFYTGMQYLSSQLVTSLHIIFTHPFSQVRETFNLLGIFFVLIRLLLKPGSRMTAILLFWAISISAMRGTTSFHSDPYWAITAFCIAFGILGSSNAREFFKVHSSKYSIRVLVGAGEKSRHELASSGHGILAIKQLIAFSLVLAVLLPNIALAQDFLKAASGGDKYPKSVVDKEFFVKSLVKPGQHFFTNSLDLNPYVNTGITPAARMAIVVPWFTIAFENQIIADLKSEKTPLIFYNPISGWGTPSNVLANYAPKLNDFILQNYTPINADFDFYWQDWISGTPQYQPLDTVYVPNSQYSSDIKLLRKLRPDVFNSQIGSDLVPGPDMLRTGQILDNSTIAQSFQATRSDLESIHLLFSKYGNDVTPEYRLTLTDSNGVVATKSIDARSIVDNSYYIWKFPKQKDSQGKEFTLQIAPDHALSQGQYNATTGNSLLAWLTDPKTEQGFSLTIGGISQQNNLVMRLGYAIK